MLVVAGCDVARWLVKDQIGTPRILADVTGSLANIKRHDYLPYGEEVTGALRSATYGYATDCLRQDFTTYERDDETGLDYAQARYYASKQGRFISVDPDVSSAGVSDPQTWNRYAYVGNHPLVFTDPNGLKWYYNKDKNTFGWLSRDTLTDEDKAAGWVEIASTTWSVVSVTGSGTIFKSAGGSLILLPTNSQNYRNLTAEILQEARLERIDASRAEIEARTNAIFLDFISKSVDGAAAVLSGGGSVTLKVVAREVVTSLATEYVKTRLIENSLTAEEAGEIQAIADTFDTIIDVVGSRAAGQGRNIHDPSLPIYLEDGSKGERSDIDFRIDTQHPNVGQLIDGLKRVGNGAGTASTKHGTDHRPTYPPYIRFEPKKNN
ncbi:MAG: RHS repeat-associated core domain-containing protein, partial [Acidobacteria bacterium]|nr:RHS repeat-associated core domain-containing protein [Acidobacteriota bacterium]